MKFECLRGHSTDLPNGHVVEGQERTDFPIFCPQIENHPKHVYFGRVCGRLAFASSTPVKYAFYPPPTPGTGYRLRYIDDVGPIS